MTIDFLRNASLRRACGRLAPCAIAALLCGLPALAQTSAPAGAAPPVTAPSAPDLRKGFTDAMRTPEAVKAAEAAITRSAKAYRETKALTDTVTISFEIQGQKREQSIAIARDASGRRISMPGTSFVATNGKVYMLHDGSPDRFVAYTLEGSIAETLTKNLGPGNLGVPGWMYDDVEPKDFAAELAGSMIPAPRIVGYDADAGRILLEGDGANVATFTIDPTRGFLTGGLVNLAPPQAPPGTIITFTITMNPVESDKLDRPVTFDETGKRQIASPLEFGPQLIAVGEDAPAIELPALDGSGFSLAARKGKVVVVVFWGAWLPNIERYLQSVNELSKWAAESGRPVEVCAINTMDPARGDARTTQVSEWWAKQSYAFPCLVDMDEDVFVRYGFQTIPATVVIGPDGKVVAVRQHINEDRPGAVVDLLRSDCERALAPVAEPKPAG